MRKLEVNTIVQIPDTFAGIPSHITSIIMQAQDESDASWIIKNVHTHQWTFDSDSVDSVAHTLEDLFGGDPDDIGFVHIAYFIQSAKTSQSTVSPLTFRLTIDDASLGTFSTITLSNVLNLSNTLTVDTLQAPAADEQASLIIILGTK